MNCEITVIKQHIRHFNCLHWGVLGVSLVKQAGCLYEWFQWVTLIMDDNRGELVIEEIKKLNGGGSCEPETIERTNNGWGLTYTIEIRLHRHYVVQHHDWI